MSDLFFTKDKKFIPCIDIDLHRSIFDELTSEYHLKIEQITESCSFSLAMIVRYALGLSSLGGSSAVICDDSINGKIALAAARHLFNGGAKIKIILIEEGIEYIKDNILKKRFINEDLSYLIKCGVEIITIDTEKISLEELKSTFSNIVEDLHNLIAGLSIFETVSEAFIQLIYHINDCALPIHCVQIPFGIHPSNKGFINSPLFASSTLSLGIPLTGLYKNFDTVGRHYVCDISIPHLVLQQRQIDFPIIFHEQPVVQIFKEEEE